MREILLEKVKGRELKVLVYASELWLLLWAFLSSSPAEILSGMRIIILSRDALITDYFALANMGAAFFNAFLVVGIAILLMEATKMPYTGLTMAAIFINMGYGLWGKNPVNVLPILFGTWLYTKAHHIAFGRQIYTALFGTCLAPFVMELVYMLPFGWWGNLVTAVGIGIFLGFVLPSLSMHTASMHMGYNLFNVGFSGGMLAFVMVCVLKSLGFESESVFIWQEGVPVKLAAAVLIHMLAVFLYGWWLSGGKWDGVRNIMSHSGRVVSDFVLMEGPGATLMNMGLVGMAGMLYILAIGGDLSGPVLGALWTAMGFAAFGAHLKGYLPVLAGVFLSTFFTEYTPTSPGLQLAALFAVGLSPIAGQFGPLVGVVAGILHAAIVMCTSQMYGGLNLYNNGFSAGWVAIVLVPVCEGFLDQQKFRKRKERKKREWKKKDQKIDRSRNERRAGG